MKKKTEKNYSNKIVLVSNSSWYLYNFRYSLLILLKKKGFSVVLIAPLDSYSKKLKDAGFIFYDWDLNRRSINPFKEIISILKLIKIFKKTKPNLIHNFTIKACLYGSIAAKLLNIKNIINSITGLGQIFISNKPVHLFLRLTLRPFYKFVLKNINSLVIFQNPSDQKKLIEIGITKKNKSKIIKGSGVDINFFNPLKKNYLKTNKIPKILFPSRLIYEKGLKELIAACEFLWKKNIKFQLLIAGGVEFANSSLIKKKDLDKIKTNKNIKILGHIHDMYSLYQSIDIVVLPSWREGLSRTLIESAAMQKPIITSNVCGCNDVIDHGINGILIPPKDEKALSLGIELLIRNPKFAKKLGMAAREKMINEFDVSLINHQTIDIYKKLLKLNL